jgi:glycosyltransferase involved in cell wall biosynthesis
MACDVSAVIATYNRRDLVLEAITSVLDQTLPPDEVIVVDHGSSDGTPDLLRERFGARIRVVVLPHEGGTGDVRNAGLAHATRSRVAFLDDDDLWRPTKLALQLEALRQSDARWCFTGFTIETAPTTGGTTKRVHQQETRGRDTYEGLLSLRIAAPLPSILVSRALAKEVGEFNGRFFHDDMDFVLRLARVEPAAVCPEPLLVIRKAPRSWAPRDSTLHHLAMLEVFLEEYRRPPVGMGRSLLRRDISGCWRAVALAQWRGAARASALGSMLRAVETRLFGPRTTRRALPTESTAV